MIGAKARDQGIGLAIGHATADKTQGHQVAHMAGLRAALIADQLVPKIEDPEGRVLHLEALDLAIAQQETAACAADLFLMAWGRSGDRHQVAAAKVTGPLEESDSE